MKTINQLFMLLASIALASGIATAGYFISQTIQRGHTGVNVAEVKGLSERKVKADFASWTIGFSLKLPSDHNIAGFYKEAEGQQEKIINFLVTQGFAKADLKAAGLHYSLNEYRNKNRELVSSTHNIRGEVIVRSKDVDRVDQAQNKISQLIADGIFVQNQEPRYLFTSLNEIKPDMLKEATENARVAAQEFANNAGVKVAHIKRAVQGGFFIKDYGEDYSDNTRIEKIVRVVTTITFYLSN